MPKTVLHSAHSVLFHSVACISCTITFVPLLAFRCVFALSLMSCTLLCHVKCCMRSVAHCSVLHGSQSGYSANCYVLHVIQTVLWPQKLPSAYHRLYCNLRALFCSVLSCYLHQLQVMPLLAFRCGFALSLISTF